MHWVFPVSPTPPGWHVVWDDILAAHPWLATLAGVVQDPLHHAEGDVLVHTRLVAEALAALPGWRALPDPERSWLFGAVLLHDIGKRTCTVVGADSRVTSPRHARVGAMQARLILWDDPTLPLSARETIVALVRHHGLPLWFLEKPDPDRAIYAASQAVRLDWVALLAEADARGRICSDQADLIERIQLFRIYAQEHECLEGPRQFASDHSRFVYFAQPTHPDGPVMPPYAAYDDTTCTMTIMVGLPGAGKDTYVRRHFANLPIIALDDIRRELKIAPTAHQGAVIAEAQARARTHLRQHQSFVWNATNITRALRSQVIALGTAYRARITLIYVDAPLLEILRRNAQRTAPVPETVIRRLAAKLEVPDLTEAHTVHWVSTI